MYRKIALAGATAAAIVGVGTAAIAASAPSSTSGSATRATTTAGSQAKHTSAKHDAGARQRVLRRAVHASIVTKGKDGYVTHVAIRGAVTSVSPTAITVKAADGYSQTFTLTKTTHVRERSAASKKGAAGTVSDLKTGDRVAVVGKGADKAGAVPTATIVLDGLTK